MEFLCRCDRRSLPQPPLSNGHTPKTICLPSRNTPNNSLNCLLSHPESIDIHFNEPLYPAITGYMTAPPPPRPSTPTEQFGTAHCRKQVVSLGSAGGPGAWRPARPFCVATRQPPAERPAANHPACYTAISGRRGGGGGGGGGGSLSPLRPIIAHG